MVVQKKSGYQLGCFQNVRIPMEGPSLGQVDLKEFSFLEIKTKNYDLGIIN